AVAVELVGIDDRRDDAPERLGGRVAQKYRVAPDKAGAALDELDRPREDQLAQIAGTIGRFALRLDLGVVEPDGLFIALEREAHGDLEAGRAGNAAQLRILRENLTREAGEARLAHAGLRHERRDKAA